MIRTQIQLTSEQSNGLKRMAKRKNKSIAELIRLSVDKYIASEGLMDDEQVKKMALDAVGKLHGPKDLAINHDDYLGETFSK
jgi:hypothetical protein